MCLTRKQMGNVDMSRTPEKNVVLYTNSTETKRSSHWTHRIVTPLSGTSVSETGIKQNPHA